MSLIDEYPSLLSKNVGDFEFMRIFRDGDECLNLYFHLKFEGRKCVKCSRLVTENYSRIKARNAKGFRCKSCHTVIYPLADTIFRGSPLGVNTLFLLIYSLSNPTSSTSAVSLEHKVGVTRKHAHRISMSIRKLLLRPITAKMSGSIEIDECFLGKG